MPPPSLWNLHRSTRRLLAARFLRSIGQGTLVVDFALYLYALGWSGLGIGSVLTVSGLLSVCLNLPAAIASDRWRRKPFLLLYEGGALLAALVAMATSRTELLAAAGVLGGFGRGASGAAGPFSPAEQAWVAEEVPPRRRGWVYSLLSTRPHGSRACIYGPMSTSSDA